MPCGELANAVRLAGCRRAASWSTPSGELVNAGRLAGCRAQF
jgi:hypothetical protein